MINSRSSLDFVSSYSLISFSSVATTSALCSMLSKVSKKVCNRRMFKPHPDIVPLVLALGLGCDMGTTGDHISGQKACQTAFQSSLRTVVNSKYIFRWALGLGTAPYS